MRATLVSNSHFFARLESRNGSVWLVWGNPNQETANEALVKKTTMRSLRDWICIVLEKDRRVE